VQYPGIINVFDIIKKKTPLRGAREIYKTWYCDRSFPMDGLHALSEDGNEYDH
jgi:hypothetical protein